MKQCVGICNGFLLDNSNWHENQYRIVEVSWITQLSDYAGSTVVKMRDVVRDVKIPELCVTSERPQISK